MTANGWLQIAAVLGGSARLTKPLGVYMVRVYDGTMGWLRPVERVLYRLSGVDADEDQHWTRYAAAMLLFSAASMLLTYVALRLQHVLPLNPAGAGGRAPTARRSRPRPRFTTNTNWQSYAGEATMSYFSQMTPARVPQLRLGGGGHGGRGRAGARHRAARPRAASATSGSTWSAARSTCCCRSRLVLALLFVQQGVIQNFAPYSRSPRSRAQADARHGAGGEPGGDQAARHERRRLLQRQLGPSVREPDAADQLPGQMFAIFLIPAGADLHVRAHGRETARRLGALGGDVPAVLRRRHDRLLGRGARQPDPRRPRDRRRGLGRAARAATWRARRSGSGSPTPRCSRR